ncbi:MAG: SMC-Scp complex subunit ScpB [Candidatus Omnitrophica bacterium]|nr:SMC-Scp complex subunit ScpB [Candidatus Omnitrophota bacterium]
MEENNIKSAIEALLFACEKPLLLEQIKKALDGIDVSVIRKAIEDLKTEYKDSNRGMAIIEVAGGYQMISSLNFAPFLKKLFKERHTERLSKPALETLAIIAYKQPITRIEIESLRGVNIDGVMSSLVEKDLIKIAGRKKAPGSPYVYGTTKKFLEHFGLMSLNDLPKMEDFTKLEAQDLKNGLDELTAQNQNLAEDNVEQEKAKELVDEPKQIA